MSVIVLFFTGCLSTEISQYKPIPPGQVYVSQFTGKAGPLVSNGIQIELQKQKLLAPNEDQAEFLLTGHIDFIIYSDGIAFALKDKNDILYLRGNATSGGWLTPMSCGRELAKKISKKFPKNLTKN